MTNVEKLKRLGILGVVRQRMGTENDDDVYDEDINEMDNSKLIEKWCGWYLGDGSWWTEMKNKFDRLVDLDNSEKNTPVTNHTIKFTDVENRTDYLSVDKTKAISAHGELFTVGDLVEHEDDKAGTATIESFVFDFETNDVVANTEKGSARICFITKVTQVEI
jgi:hypothetical protein